VSTTSTAPVPLTVPTAAHADAGGRRTARWVAAAGTAAAGALHVVAAVDHLGAGDLVVGFFLATALAQVGAAAWLAADPTRDLRLPVALLVGTLGLLVLYVVGHATDLLDPFLGHDHAAQGQGVQGQGVQGQGVQGQGAGTDHAAHTTATGPVALGLEPVEVPAAPVLGTLTAAAECLALAALAALLPAAARRRVLDGVLAVGALVWLLWLTGVLA
jgi:hypothetical protein